MKTQVYLGIAIRIIVLFSIGMFWTYVPDQLREFFGDKFDGGPAFMSIDSGWNWGARHYWFHWMMTSLFLLSAVNFIMQIGTLVDKNYGK